MSTKSYAVPPQRDRDMPSRSDCGWQAKMLRYLLDDVRSQPLLEIRITNHFVHLLQTNAAHQYRRPKTENLMTNERKGSLGGKQRR